MRTLMILALAYGSAWTLALAAGVGDAEVWSALVGATPADLGSGRWALAALGMFGLIVSGRVALGESFVAERWRGFLPSWLRILFGLLLLYLAVVELQELANVLSRVTDFGTFYEAAVAVREGQDPYAATRVKYLYPPTFAHGFWPLTWVPVVWASVVALVLKTWLLVQVTRWTLELVEAEAVVPRFRPWFLLALLFSTARFWIADLQFGNTNLLIVWLVIGVLRFDLGGRVRLAGVLLAIAVTTKVVPVLLVVWLLARRRYETLAVFGLAMVAVNGVPFLLDPDAASGHWRSYYEAIVVGRLGGDATDPINQSLRGVTARLLDQSPRLGLAIWAGTSAALLGGAGWLTHRAESGSRRQKVLAAALFPPLLLICSPGSWVVHYVGAFLPIALLARWSFPPRRGRAWVLFAALQVPLTVSGWFRFSVRWSLEGAWFFATILIVFGVLAWVLRVETTHQSEPKASA